MARQPVNNVTAGLEETILGNVGFDDEEDVTHTDDEELGEEGEEEDEPGADEDDGSDGDGEGDEEGDGDGEDEGADDAGLKDFVNEGQQQQQQRPAQRVAGNLVRDGRGNVVVKGTKVDGRGNVVDASGKIVARAGTERRFYDEMNKARLGMIELRSAAVANEQNLAKRLNRAVQIGTELHGRLTAMQEAGNEGTKMGLNQAEVSEALAMMAEGKRDPGGLLKKLLTRAVASGIDVTKLGLQQNAYDPKSVIDMVNQAVQQAIAPLSQDVTTRQQERQTREQYEQYRAQVEGQVNDFFDRYPDMKQYVPVFNAVLNDERFKNMTLDEIRLRILLNRRNQKRPRVPNQQRQRQRPNGNPSPSRVPAQRGKEMAATTSYDTIIREAMKDGGSSTRQR